MDKRSRDTLYVTSKLNNELQYSELHYRGRRPQSIPDELVNQLITTLIFEFKSIYIV